MTLFLSKHAEDRSLERFGATVTEEQIRATVPDLRVPYYEYPVTINGKRGWAVVKRGVVVTLAVNEKRLRSARSRRQRHREARRARR